MLMASITDFIVGVACKQRRDTFLRVSCACTLGALALHAPATVHEWLLASCNQQQARRARRRERGSDGKRRQRQRRRRRDEETNEDLATRWCALLVVEGPKVLRGKRERVELKYGLAGLTMVLEHDVEKRGLALLSFSSFFLYSTFGSTTGAGEVEGKRGGGQASLPRGQRH